MRTDMYEHAYHLEFSANASAYVDAFMRLIEWTAVTERLTQATAGGGGGLIEFRGEAATKFRARLRFSICICLRIHRSLTDIRPYLAGVPLGGVWTA
jgi:hypothetical protein